MNHFQRKAEEQHEREKDDIKLTLLFAKLLKIARKKSRSEKDFDRINEIESNFNWIIQV